MEKVNYNNIILTQEKAGKETIKPSVGNVLIRTEKKTNNTKYFVVYQASQKNNVVNKIMLYEITNYDKLTNEFEFNKKSYIMLTLSSASTWFNKNMEENFNWYWYRNEINFF